jgi:hypothetical protein
MRTVGICRFSYLGKGGFKVGHDDPAALAAFLYDEGRMEERFRLFEAITLPCVAQQTDPDFTFLIITGKWLPARYLERLRALTSDVSQCTIRQYPPRPTERSCQRPSTTGAARPTRPACNSALMMTMQWR